MADELLIVDKQKDKLKVRITDKVQNKWVPEKYVRIIKNKDFNLIAHVLYDLDTMGYPIDKAHQKFRQLKNDPDLFFLK